jgi:hypothetical protein
MFDETVKIQLEQALNGIRQTLDTNVAELKSDPKMMQIIEAHKALNDLEGMLERVKTSLAEVFGLESPKVEEKSVAGKIDEYYGLLPLEAAKRYLKKKGSAANLDEIVAAIRAGGCVVNSPANLRKTLTRSTWQVAKIGNNAFGLVEFYPHAKRGGKKKDKANGTESGEASEIEADVEEDGLVLDDEQEEETQEGEES